MTKNRKRKKAKPLKKFKGCLKMPLITSMPFEEFAARCSYTGEWLTRRKEILAERVCRQWFVNVYIVNAVDGSITVENVTTSSKLDKVALNDLVDLAIASVQDYPDIDLTQSYLTVSC